MSFIDIINKIADVNKIIIFRHGNPDGDAACSQLAMEQFIKDNYPHKLVYRAGFDDYLPYPVHQEVDDTVFEHFLAIVLDCGNVERVDDQRFQKADYIIKIDHHPPLEQFGNLNYVDSSASACCQILAEMFLSTDLQLSGCCCEYLLAGILTDTLNFKTTNTSARTLAIASSLLERCNSKISDIAENVFSRSLDEFNIATKLRNLLQYKNGLGYLVLSAQDLSAMAINWRDAKNQVSEFGDVKELKVWSIFVYNDQSGLYEGSLRSKRPYILNQLIRKYNGGGHPNAVGVKGITLEDVNELLYDLQLLIEETDNDI